MAQPPDPLTLVRVAWSDCFTEDAWAPIVDLLLRKPYLIETVGWYIGKAEGNWVITTGMDTKGNGGSTWFIPEVLVKTWAVLG